MDEISWYAWQIWAPSRNNWEDTVATGMSMKCHCQTRGPDTCVNKAERVLRFEFVKQISCMKQEERNQKEATFSSWSTKYIEVASPTKLKEAALLIPHQDREITEINKRLVVAWRRRKKKGSNHSEHQLLLFPSVSQALSFPSRGVLLWLLRNASASASYQQWCSDCVAKLGSGSAEQHSHISFDWQPSLWLLQQ